MKVSKTVTIDINYLDKMASSDLGYSGTINEALRLYYNDEEIEKVEPKDEVTPEQAIEIQQKREAEQICKPLHKEVWDLWHDLNPKSDSYDYKLKYREFSNLIINIRKLHPTEWADRYKELITKLKKEDITE